MRISNRLPVSLAPTAFSLLLESQRGRVDFLDLTVSNPTRCGFKLDGAPWRAALSHPAVLDYEADPSGHLAVREAIAAHHGHGVEAADILLTASTSDAYAWLFKLLGDPGDEVLVPIPSYPLFEHLAAFEGLRPVPVAAYFHERWCLDLAAMASACGPRTRAIVVVNPNNPTGQFLSLEEWRGLTSLCARRGLSLLVDEVFADFALEPGPGALRTALMDAAPPCPVFVLSGLSKVALLPQLKLGWILLRGPARDYRDALAFIADQYLSVSAPVQAAAPLILPSSPTSRQQVIQRAQANLAALDERLRPHPHLARLPVEGGWSVLLRRPALDADAACAFRLLQTHSVLVHPGHFFDLPGEGFLVLSLITPLAIFCEGISRILPRLSVD